MNLEQWIETVRGMCASQGRVLSDEDKEVLRSKIAMPQSVEEYQALYAEQACGSPPGVSLQSYGQLVRIGVLGLGPIIPKEQQKVFGDVTEGVLRDFFKRLCRGEAFGSVEKIPVKHRALIERYSDSHREFTDLLRVYGSFVEEVEDLFPAPESSTTVLAQALGSAKHFLKGLFFPSEGPYRVDLKTRIANQERILKEYAPTFDTQAYFTNNPMLNLLRVRQAKWPAYVVIAGVLVGTLFVPQDRVWGKVLYWVLMGVLVVAVCDASSFVRRSLLRIRFSVKTRRLNKIIDKRPWQN